MRISRRRCRTCASWRSTSTAYRGMASCSRTRPSSRTARSSSPTAPAGARSRTRMPFALVRRRWPAVSSTTASGIEQPRLNRVRHKKLGGRPAAELFGDHQVLFLELVRDRLERRAKARSDLAHHGDRGDRDQGGDEAILDRRRSRFIAEKLDECCEHQESSLGANGATLHSKACQCLKQRGRTAVNMLWATLLAKH